MAKKNMNKNLELDLLVLSDYAYLAEGRKLSIVGAFDMIGVRKLPSTHPEFFLVARLKGEPESDHEVKIQIKDPNGEELLKDIPTHNIKLGGYGIGNITHRFLNFPFNNTGTYKVEVISDGKRIGETELRVIKVSTQKNGEGEGKAGN